jgi:hypothetical protein
LETSSDRLEGYVGIDDRIYQDQSWCKDLGLWLTTYDSRGTDRGIAFSYSRTPWGPWSEPQIVFNAIRDGALGKFINDPRSNPNDGLFYYVLSTWNPYVVILMKSRLRIE